jgi:hypothetical protein
MLARPFKIPSLLCPAFHDFPQSRNGNMVCNQVPTYIHDTAVDVAGGLEAEQRGAMRRVIENKRLYCISLSPREICRSMDIRLSHKWGQLASWWPGREYDLWKSD